MEAFLGPLGRREGEGMEMNWIQPSVELPRYGRRVLMTWRTRGAYGDAYKHVSFGERVCTDANGEQYRIYGDQDAKAVECLAWMPVPDKFLGEPLSAPAAGGE